MVSERGAINAVKTLLERNKLVVQEYDTRNDYGKDLVIDLTEDGEITGVMIAAQVKGGATYFHGNIPFVPARPNDVRLWADSTVPVIGIVWRDTTDELYWTNLTEHCRALLAGYRQRPPTSSRLEEIRLSNRLTDKSLPKLVAAMKVFARSTSNDAYLFLLDADDDVRREGVFTCWTYGRGDARALILLRRVLPYLKGRSFLDGVWALNAIVGNPDVFYDQGNWIPPAIEADVRQHLIWTADEVATMYYEHELLDEDRSGWQRGGTGQMLWHLLNPMGVKARPSFDDALGIAVARRQYDAAFRLLVAIQWLAESPSQALQRQLESHPALAGREDVNMLIEYVTDWGRCDVYG
jgi:hypothetical protein